MIKLKQLITEDIRSQMANQRAAKGLTAVSKETGKRVYFGSKQAMKQAIKKGTHEPFDAEKYKKVKADREKDKATPKTKATKIGVDPFDNTPVDDRDEKRIKDVMYDTEKGIWDAVDRGKDYNVNVVGVVNMVKQDVENAKNNGATIEDFEKLAVKMDDTEASEIIKDALEDVFGDAGNLADPSMDNPGYDKASIFDPDLSDSIQKEFKQYDQINKNLLSSLK
jgi:hypothetical protein